MYIGHILVCPEQTLYCSNAELIEPLKSLYEHTWAGPCDEYPLMGEKIETLLTPRSFFPVKYKYVIGTKQFDPEGPLDLTEMAVVFPQDIYHDRMAFLFDRVLYAGFVHFTRHGAVPSGESIGLRKHPGRSDHHVLKRCLGDKYWRGKF